MRRFWSLAANASLTAIFLVAFSHTAAAGPVLLTLVGANLGCNPGAGCPNIDGDEDLDFENVGAGSISVTNLTDAFIDPFFTYSAAAESEYGRLHARAIGSYNLASSDTRSALAVALMTDQLTISSPGLNGQAGTLDISVLLDGMLQHTAGAGAAIIAFVTAGQDPDPFSANNQGDGIDSDSLPPGGLVEVSVDFVFGQPFYLSMILGVTAGTPVSCLACNGGDSNLGPTSGIGSGTADFFNTMTLTGLLPIYRGTPVVDAQYSSVSGTAYSATGVVPEPGSLLLLGSGLTLALKRRRRR